MFHTQKKLHFTPLNYITFYIYPLDNEDYILTLLNYYPHNTKSLTSPKLLEGILIRRNY